MTWTLTRGSTVVTLPMNPESASVSNPAVVEYVEIPGDQPFIFALGKEAKTLRISGQFYDPTKTRNDLMTSYVNPIEGFVMKVVTISNAGAGYDGDWILTEFSWEEEAGVVNKIKYTMQFIKGSEMITL
ncbi:MAG: hypothetical protein ACUVUF_07800 [Candidatus Bathycorpusculaceae bacterium]